MRYVLILLLYITGLDVGSAAGCPYEFDQATSMMIPSTCYNNYTEPDPGNCCWFIHATYLYAGILHANATGEAFLPFPTAYACSTAFAGHLLSHGLVPRRFVSEDRCSLKYSSYISAGTHACFWQKVSSIASAVSLTRPALVCSTKDLKAAEEYCAACRNEMMSLTLKLMGTTQKKEYLPCGVAATIGIWYRSPNLIRFRSYVLCVVEYLDNVPILRNISQLVPPPPSSSTPDPVHEAPSSSPPSSSSSSIKVVATAVSGSIVALALLFILLLIRRRRLNGVKVEGIFTTSSYKSPLVPLPVHGMYIFTPKELSAATAGFDLGLLLGKGGSGRVYLGTLPSGQRVAVKRIYVRWKVEEFYREVEIVAGLRHRRLTTLVGYCLHPREFALVYEYMPGGSLAGAIRSGVLTWRQRVRVAADVAEGLAYLHSARVVHRDVKPGNVLLDENLSRAKLSDFGVSRIVPTGQTHLSTDMKGTMGYLDPDSFPEGHVSESTDMFSYGVVLLELVTGRRAVEPTVSGGAESIVHRFKEEEWESRVEDVVDPRIAQGADMDCVGAIFALARACVRLSKPVRPSAEDAWVELKRLLVQMGGIDDEKDKTN